MKRSESQSRLLIFNFYINLDIYQYITRLFAVTVAIKKDSSFPLERPLCAKPLDLVSTDPAQSSPQPMHRAPGLESACAASVRCMTGARAP